MIRFVRYAVIATAAFTLGALAQEKPTEKKAAKKAAENAVEKKSDTVETKKTAAKQKAEAAVEEKKTATEKKAPVAAKGAEKKAVAKAGAPYSGGIVNLNTATKSQLEALPGVGEANANHIIKGRPYKSADELITRKIIQERYYSELKAYVTTK